MHLVKCRLLLNLLDDFLSLLNARDLNPHIEGGWLSAECCLWFRFGASFSCGLRLFLWLLNCGGGGRGLVAKAHLVPAECKLLSINQPLKNCVFNQNPKHIFAHTRLLKLYPNVSPPLLSASALATTIKSAARHYRFSVQCFNAVL